MPAAAARGRPRDVMSVMVLSLAYDGTAFRGWAMRPLDQDDRGRARSPPRTGTGETVKLSVAGRTDAGVHASGQVTSFRTGTSVAPGRLQKALNSVLAPEVVVVRARLAPDGFDARFSATARRYVYRIDEAPLADPFTGRFARAPPGRLALAPMRRAARISRGGTTSGASAGKPGATVRRSGVCCG